MARNNWRRVARGAGWIIPGLLAVLIIVGAIALGWLNTSGGKEWLRKKALSTLRDRVPGLELGKLEGFLPFHLTLNDLRVKDPHGRVVFTVRMVYADPMLLSLLSRELRLKELRIDEPRVFLSQDRQGRWNLARVVTPAREEKKPPKLGLRVDELTVSGGSVALRREGDITGTIRKMSLRAEVAFTRGELRTELSSFQLSYRAAGLAGIASAEGRARITATGTSALVQAKITSEDGRVLPIRVDVHGPRRAIRGDLRVGRRDAGHLVASAVVDLPAKAYRAIATLADFDPAAVLPRLPHGNLELALTVRGRGVPLKNGTTLDARLSSPGFELAGQRVDSLRARFTSRGSRWQLDPFRVSGPAARVSVVGEGTAGVLRAEAHLEAPDLGPLRLGDETLRANAKLDLELRRRKTGMLLIAGRTDVRHLQVGETELKGLRVTLNGRASPDSGRGTVTLATSSPFQISGLRIQSVRLDARADGERLSVQAAALPAPRAGHSFRPAELRASLPLQRASFRVAPRRPLRAHARWSTGSLRELARALRVRQPLDGRLAVALDVAGTLRTPTLKGAVVLREARWKKLRHVEARVELATRSKKVTATARASVRGTKILRARASLEEPLGDLLRRRRWLAVPVDVQAMPSFAANLLAPVVPGLKDLPLRLGARLDLDGTLARPELRARAVATRTRSGAPVTATAELTARVRGGRSLVHADVRVQDDRLLRIRANTDLTPAALLRGPQRSPGVHVEGSLGPFPLARVGELNPSWQPLRGRLTGDLRLAGPPDRLVGTARLSAEKVMLKDRPLGELRGSARLTATSAKLEGSLQQRQGRATLSGTLDRSGKARLEMSASRLDLAAVRRLWKESPLADDRLEGSVLVEASVEAKRGRRGATPLTRLRDPERITGSVTVDGAQLAFFFNQPEKEGAAAEKKKPIKAERFAERLKAMVPFHLERLEVRRSALVLVDASSDRRPRLNLDEVALTLENLANREHLMKGVPTILTFRTVVERSGETVAFATFDPLAEKPLAAGRAALYGLKLARINDFLGAHFDVKIPEGTFSCFVSFRVDGNQITGAIKPVVRNAELEPAESASWLKAAGIEAVDLFAELVTDDVPGRDAIATVIPIKGTLDQPDIQILPTVLGVIRNAFVVGLASGFSGLLPDTAKAPQSIFTQAAEALTEKGQPKAQPKGGR